MNFGRTPLRCLTLLSARLNPGLGGWKIGRRSQFGGVTTIGWTTPFSYGRPLFWNVPEPTAVRRVVIARLAKQLGIAEPFCANFVNTDLRDPGNAP
jgi:hypothetical protein